MGVKYRIDYFNELNQKCRVDIGNPAYFGDPILLRSVEGSGCVIEKDVSDDPYEPICNTKAITVVYNQGSIDTTELKHATDREFTFDFYIDSFLKFKGFLIPDGIQTPLRGVASEITITAQDGLMLLDTIDYKHADLTGGRCILNYFRQILFSPDNLGLPLPLRWVNVMRNDAYPLEADVFTGSIRWAPGGEGFTDYNGNVKSCMYILEGVLRSQQSRIYQDEGYWKIDRINDIASGHYVYRETPGTLSGFTVTDPVAIGVVKTVSDKPGGDYRFIEDNALTWSEKAFKSVVTTYEQDQRSNIVPNGNMDLATLDNKPMYWDLENGSTAVLSLVGTLSNTIGKAAKIVNPPDGLPTHFEMKQVVLPIDTDRLYSNMTFGFKFRMDQGAVDGDGFIDWEASPFTFRMIYNNGSVNYYLNEFGFWSPGIGETPVRVDNLKLADVANVDFNSKQNIILPLPAITPIGRTQAPSLTLSFQVPAGRTVVYDDIYINVDDNSDVYKSTFNGGKYTGKAEYSLKISSSHNGFYVSNLMSSFSKSGLEKFYSDPKVSGLTLTAMTSHAILRNRYKPSEIFEGSIYGATWMYGQLYQIESLAGMLFMPLRTKWNTETCTIELTAIEVRDDSISITTEHYGKNDNDKTLSN